MANTLRSAFRTAVALNLQGRSDLDSQIDVALNSNAGNVTFINGTITGGRSVERTMEKITKVGVVGSGFIAKGFVIALHKHPDIEISKVLTRTEIARRIDFPMPSLLTNSVDELLENSSIVTPAEADYARHVYHIYAICTRNRDNLKNALAQKGVHCGIHYPIPIHLQPAYAFLGYQKGSFPVTEKCVQELLSLPMYPELSAEQIETVTTAIGDFDHNVV